MHDLIDNPLWRPEDLGRPIPDSPHAVSVCLPTWRDNIGYEEGEPRVTSRLRAGYPRFVFNPLCSQLFADCRNRFAREAEACQVYPTRAAAERFGRYFESKTGTTARVVPVGYEDVQAVCYPQTHDRIARDYWQHAGEGISSRRAEAILHSQAPQSPDDHIPLLRARIAALAGVAEECVCLFPSGMAALAAVDRALHVLFPKRRSVQFGFPYVDTLKIQQKFGSGVHFFPRGDEGDLQQLEHLLQREPVAGLFTEFPSNPLLQSPDLGRLSDLTRQHDCPLIVDETIASLANVDLASVADVVSTSLTKYFSGVGDVMGGALLLNASSPYFTDLSTLLTGQGEELLWGADLAVLEQNSRDFADRMRGINFGAARLAEFLRSHPRVRRVYAPQFESPAMYQMWQRPEGGYGGLFSLSLHEEASCGPRFFDALRVCKGPNLGMSYTLACPYTILAHYGELDFAESCGMSRYLIRVSVGLEDSDDLSGRFADALACLDD
ncbi:MAG: PLP-dependent transferase [Planctomycetaceae bacterium]|nr:PLP-dependent transferase [Planctomycetaceae bacterium]